MAHTADHDRVVMVSRKADGSADQTPDYTIIGDKQFAIDAATEQLKQQRVSAADVEMRGAGGSGSAAGDSAPDAAVQKIIDAHEKAASGAASDAESEVNSHFEDLNADAAKRNAPVEAAARRGAASDARADAVETTAARK